MLGKNALQPMLARLDGVRIGVIGDYCLDAYWTLDRGAAEISVETGLPTRAVRRQRYGLGGAANVVSNLAALEPAAIRAVTVIGDDVFGHEMLRLLEALGVETCGVIVAERGWDTPVYAKSFLEGEEQERIDFGRFKTMTAELEQGLIEQLHAAAAQVDLLIVNQQLSHDFYTPGLIAAVNGLADRMPVVFDTRDRLADFRGGTLKCNARELAAACGAKTGLEVELPIDEVREHARTFHARDPRTLLITRGAWGMYVYDGREDHAVPGIQHLAAIDPVGAGDAATAAFAACLAAGCSAWEAMNVANVAAAVTVRKVGETGTASRAEIADQADQANYLYRPEVAADARQAVTLDDTEIEIVNPDIERGRLVHAVFDHDGTISTLREGWEEVMAPVMVEAILGGRHADVSEKELRRVTEHVADYIDRSTGIQTILQMQGLVEMVREFGYVPDEQILDAMGYKRIYNDALMAHVDARRRRFEAGELDVEDFTIKGAVDFLRELSALDVRLYLASGTDEQDVRDEAALLGYADLFDGGIFGAVGDVTKYSKRMVLERIIREHGLAGAELVTFGDGPVELRETKRCGGIAVGVASNELRRFGLNADKRARLITAGADLVVGDFSQRARLLDFLGCPVLYGVRAEHDS